MRILLTRQLGNDIDRAVDACKAYPWFDGLDDVRQETVANMMFNLGPAKFAKFVSLIAALGKGKFTDAADAMLDSLWCKQVTGRCKRLVNQMASGRIS